jgi:hypothetical protein
MRRSGLRRDAVYLIRPDGYVTMVDRDGHAEALISYLDTHQIRPTTTIGRATLRPSRGA